MRQLALVGQNAGHAFTACALGRPIGAAGVTLQIAGRGQAWAIFSPLIRNRPVSLFRAVKHGLEEIIAETKVKKLYAVVDQDDEAAKRFMTHLGFHVKQHLFEREPKWHRS